MALHIKAVGHRYLEKAGTSLSTYTWLNSIDTRTRKKLQITKNNNNNNNMENSRDSTTCYHTIDLAPS